MLLEEFSDIFHGQVNASHPLFGQTFRKSVHRRDARLVLIAEEIDHFVFCEKSNVRIRYAGTRRKNSGSVEPVRHRDGHILVAFEDINFVFFRVEVCRGKQSTDARAFLLFETLFRHGSSFQPDELSSVIEMRNDKRRTFKFRAVFSGEFHDGRSPKLQLVGDIRSDSPLFQPRLNLGNLIESRVENDGDVWSYIEFLFRFDFPFWKRRKSFAAINHFSGFFERLLPYFVFIAACTAVNNDRNFFTAVNDERKILISVFMVVGARTLRNPAIVIEFSTKTCHEGFERRLVMLNFFRALFLAFHKDFKLPLKQRPHGGAREVQAAETFSSSQKFIPDPNHL